ncbi:MAG TPA: ATP-dependent helicase HrpB [Cytophagaceae bacterium]|jgi:ATP-dependent helicase HrpB
MSEQQLPIVEIIPELKKILAENNTLILQAPPGAGKSTLLPLELIKEQWMAGKKILMLEPRRLAARAVATRMSQMIGEEVGGTVGYRVRFDNKVTNATRIEVLTEGVLTRTLQKDNFLEGVGMVIFDEFHERSLNADLALALCREVQTVLREDLKILIMSATINGEQLSKMLGNAPILTSQGRQYPIEQYYLANQQGIGIAVQMAAAIKRVLSKHEGDVLAFLPGAGEIGRTSEILAEEFTNVKICPLYGDLTQAKQQEAIMPDPNGKRKVVLATSIAETSLTIEGIKVVVDSGYSRVQRFDPKTGLSKLETIKVTKDAADQRAGRAGRLGPGVCYRLWSEGTHQHLIDQRVPEILDADLSPLILELANWGVKDLRKLAWLTHPPAGAIAQARQLLTELEALENDKITNRGKEMLNLPTHPRIGHLLLIGKQLGLLPLAADIAAILEERDPLKRDTGANFILRLESLRQWRKKENTYADKGILERIERLASSWRNIFKTAVDNEKPNEYGAGRLIAAAYPERVARQQKQDKYRYRLVNGRIAKLNDHDTLVTEEWISIAHMDGANNEAKIYLASPVSIENLTERVTQKEVVNWDSNQGVLVARTESRIGDIIVNSKPILNFSDDQRIEVLCGAVKAEGLKLLNWNDEIYNWQARIASLRVWRTEEEWPDVSTHHLIQTCEDWLPAYLGDIRKADDFKKLELTGILASVIPWELSQRLDVLVPKQIKVPSGSMVALQYFHDGRDPILAVRLQELFGLVNTPTINEGRTKVLLHLLSPGYKPVQVTQDLKSFWENTYPDVRKELRVRYIRHHWPEDPWTAEAMRGAKKRGS